MPAARTATAPPLPALPALRRIAGAAAQVAAHAFKGLQDWVEVFTVGTHVDSKAREATFTAEDLDQMAANVAGAGVPAVLGHPKDIDPAYAWAKPGDVKRDGDALLAKFTDIHPGFEAGVDSGAYRERSVSIYKDPKRGWVLQHVGWLGAAAPAIAGMTPLAYSAARAADAAEAAETHEFASMSAGWALQDVATLLRGLREWVIAKEGLDTANQVLPDWTISGVQAAAQRVIDDAARDQAEDATEGGATGNGLAPLFTQHTTTTTGAPAMNFTQADIDAAAEKARKDALAAEEPRFAAQGRELSELRAQRQNERIGTQINGWKAAGVLLPAEEPGLVEFMAALEGGTAAEFSFAAADKSQAKQTPAQWFAAFVAGRKALLKLGGSGNAAADDDTDTGMADKEVADRARAYQSAQEAKGIRIGIGAAIDAVNAGKDRG